MKNIRFLLPSNSDISAYKADGLIKDIDHHQQCKSCTDREKAKVLKRGNKFQRVTKERKNKETLPNIYNKLRRDWVSITYSFL